MKKELEILERIYGSKREAANALGITLRHFYRLIKGNKAHKPLQKLIKYMAGMHDQNL